MGTFQRVFELEGLTELYLACSHCKPHWSVPESIVTI
jgi:hypothetical protein